uniref:Uncharacterized protein n=1 Tax=Panagrolaimus sp. ES5 TaxID=591445 RepID=A0AC34G605_9BILA
MQGFDDVQTRKDSSFSWKKSNKYLASNYLKIDRDSGEKIDLKKDSNVNNSTLSLHISAYENSVEAKKKLYGNEKDDNKGEKSDSLKQWVHAKQIFIGSPSIVQNPFEFPRQQENEDNLPELMQFKASQRLLNPNRSSSGNLYPLLNQTSLKN